MKITVKTLTRTHSLAFLPVAPEVFKEVTGWLSICGYVAFSVCESVHSVRDNWLGLFKCERDCVFSMHTKIKQQNARGQTNERAIELWRKQQENQRRRRQHDADKNNNSNK